MSTSTLRAWEREGTIQTAFRTKGGHGRYKMTEIWRKNQPQKETEIHNQLEKIRKVVHWPGHSEVSILLLLSNPGFQLAPEFITLEG